MKQRLWIYGILGALLLILAVGVKRMLPGALQYTPLLKSSISDLQVRLAGPLVVEEVPSNKKFLLSAEEGRRLAATLNFDGQRYMCADERQWKITPQNSSGFVLIIGDSCIGEFKGWVTTYGVSAQTFQMLKDLSGSKSAK